MNTKTSHTNTKSTPVVNDNSTHCGVKDFTGYPIKNNPKSSDGPIRPKPQTLCPVCVGHGAWTDSRWASIGIHCAQCNGWGWVDADSTDATCLHQDVEISRADAQAAGIVHFGMCYHVYKCVKCGRHKSTDSSD